MNFLLRNTAFGELLVEETFIYFDGPRLFLATNVVGQRFLVNCLDIDEEGEHWILTSLSERRLGALKDGTVQLRDAFTLPEMGFVYYLTTSPAGDLIQHSEALPSSLPDDVLPIPGSLLPVIQEAPQPVSSTFLARSLNASVLLLRLFPKTRQHEAPAKAVGDILSSFAVYINAKLKTAYRNAEIAVDQAGSAIAELVPEADVVGAFAGSLGVEFAVRGDEAKVMDALESAMKDLASVSDLDDLYARMIETESSEVASLKVFLYRLSSAKSDLSVEVASINSESAIHADVSLKTVRRGVRRLRLSDTSLSRTYQTLEVELVGVNLRSKTFEVRVLSNDDSLKGTVNAEVFSNVSKAELPDFYRVVLEVGPSVMGRAGALKMISATRLQNRLP